MRKLLEQIDGTRATFTATFDRMGVKSSYRGGTEPTILLTDIRGVDGNLVTEHLWFNYTREFAVLSLVSGERVEFDARTMAYRKGQRGFRDLDYKLSRPTKVHRVGEPYVKPKPIETFNPLETGMIFVDGRRVDNAS